MWKLAHGQIVSRSRVTWVKNLWLAGGRTTRKSDWALVGRRWWRHLVGRHAREAGVGCRRTTRRRGRRRDHARRERRERGSSVRLDLARGARVWVATGASTRGLRAGRLIDPACARELARPPSAPIAPTGLPSDPGAMEATPQHAPAPTMKRGVEVSNKLDPDGTSSRVRSRNRDDAPRASRHPPPLGRSSRAALGEPRKSPDGARHPRRPTRTVTLTRSPVPARSPRPSSPSQWCTRTVPACSRTCAAVGGPEPSRASRGRGARRPPPMLPVRVVDAATSGKLNTPRSPPSPYPSVTPSSNPASWPRWHSEDAAARAAALHADPLRAARTRSATCRDRPGFSETSRSRSSRARWTSINSERERVGRRIRDGSFVFGGDERDQRGAPAAARRAAEDVAARGASASDAGRGAS